MHQTTPWKIGREGKISGCGYLTSLKAGFEAGIQSFRKHLLVLAQAAARHGDGVSAEAHRTLYSLSHYSLTSRTCPINDMSLGGSHAMCGRMSRYVGPSLLLDVLPNSAAKVLEIRLTGGTANLMLSKCWFGRWCSFSNWVIFRFLPAVHFPGETHRFPENLPIFWASFSDHGHIMGFQMWWLVSPDLRYHGITWGFPKMMVPNNHGFSY